ncbi:MAG: glycosyltransferase family 2 protein [Chloracidobacterium sp.]|nr:glycosyltransferase family 2 protein [Chloracidobacterium sp.]
MSVPISIVMPVFNAGKFLHKTVEAIDAQRRESGWDIELIMIDDGSRDDTYERVEELGEKYRYIKAIKLSRNFGHQAAVRTGLEFSDGDYVAILDDDLQDPPSLLPMFFEYLDNGYDVAYGERKKRKEHILKRLAYSSFYRILRGLSSIEIPLDSGDFCVMKRRVVEHMLTLPERNPFLRGMRAWVGFKQIAVSYERQARIDGVSAYTFAKLLQLGADGIFSFSKFPIRFITFLGLLGLGVALFYSLFLVVMFFTVGVDVRGFSTLALLISFFGSLNLICLGVIGEYIARIYDETLHRPHTVIEKTLNFESPEEHRTSRKRAHEVEKA